MLTIWDQVRRIYGNMFDEVLGVRGDPGATGSPCMGGEIQKLEKDIPEDVKRRLSGSPGSRLGLLEGHLGGIWKPLGRLWGHDGTNWGSCKQLLSENVDLMRSMENIEKHRLFEGMGGEGGVPWAPK